MNAKATASATFGAGAIAAMIYGIAQVTVCQREGGYQQCKDEWSQAAPLIAGGGAAIVGLFMPQPKIPHGSEPVEPPTSRRKRDDDAEPPIHFPPLEEIIEPVVPNLAEATEDTATRMDRAYRRLQATRKRS